MRKTMVVALFMVTLIVGAFALLNSMRKVDASVPTEQILAASMELPAGTLLRAQDITWQSVSVTEPDQILRPNTAAVEVKPEVVEETAASVYGAVLRHSLGVGSPIRRGDIVKPGDRDFLQVVLTPGARAIAIPVATGGASTGLLSPGDRVDVILTQSFKANDGNQETRDTPLTRRSVGETIVQNLRVLAVDAPETKVTANANPANGNFGRTVTMEVTPDQAEKINVAAELGKLSVTLRGTTTLVSDASVFEPEHVKPQWAGDVSPALLGAAQQKPVALTPPPVEVLRGTRQYTGGSQFKDRETVKPEKEDR
jgi:pilus assembly protein CpaB